MGLFSLLSLFQRLLGIIHLLHHVSGLLLGFDVGWFLLGDLRLLVTNILGDFIQLPVFLASRLLGILQALLGSLFLLVDLVMLPVLRVNLLLHLGDGLFIVEEPEELQLYLALSHVVLQLLILLRLLLLQLGFFPLGSDRLLLLIGVLGLLLSRYHLRLVLFVFFRESTRP